MNLSHLHPMLVHFPIALVMIGFIADLSSLIYKKETWLAKASFYLLIVGTLSALVTLFSGALFTGEMDGAAGEIKSRHELFAWITVIILFFTVAFKVVILRSESAGLKMSGLLLYGIAAVCVSLTGFYGGTLVYNYMMPL
jgi:uncharacterized membrane protein